MTDRELCDGIKSHVAAAAARGAEGGHQRQFGIVETAGGVCSPTPEGSRQVRPLLLLDLHPVWAGCVLVCTACMLAMHLGTLASVCVFCCERALDNTQGAIPSHFLPFLL